MAYSSNASEGSVGEFITAFDRCPPTFSGDVLDREDIFPTQSADIIPGGSYSRTWETDHELAVLEDMSNEWTMFSDPSFENRNPMNVSKNMGAFQRDDDENNHRHHHEVMENGCNAMPKEKSARLISPDRNTPVDPAGSPYPFGSTAQQPQSSGFGSPAPASSPFDAAPAAAAVTTPNDDLSAWGFASTAATTTMERRESQTAKRPSTAIQETDDLQDAFVSNFFSSGFDVDDGFFGQSDWTAVSSPKSSANVNMSDAVGGGVVKAKNGPWGHMQGGVNPFEEKKDEDTGSVIFTNVSLPEPITPKTEPTFSHQQQQQQQQQPPGKTSNEVVVSFEDYNHEIRQSPSNSSFSSRPTTLERNVSYERGNRPPVTSKSHRRINSNGSLNSKGSRRRGGKSGGSVGSNSSAVDQILEHYRQKRLAKHHGGKTPSTASSTASSQPSSSNHRSVPSLDSLSSAPSSDMVAAAPAAAALSFIHSQKSSPLNDNMTSVQSFSSGPILSSQSSPPFLTNQSNSRVVNWPDDNGVYSTIASPPPSRNVNETARAVDDVADHFLMANIQATIGPPGSAPDMESLSGRPHNRSPRLRNRQASDAKSIDSRASRNSRYSFRTYESNRSALKSVKSMSPESKSVANDLFRLEAQLAEVARQQELQGDEPASSPREVIFVDDNTLNKNNSSNSDMSNNNGYIGAEPVPRLNPITVVAPPGKLGILLHNTKAGGVSSTPTHVSAVRSESVLAGKVQVGDLLMKIDGEDVSRCNSKQIMVIMARRSDFERVLEFRCLQSSYDPQEWI